MLEWGLNWCIGLHGHRYLIIHAAAIERNGLAFILPGAPGSGKSTLTAFLVHHGWRLLSDQQALVSLQDRRLPALTPPIGLTNRPIDLTAVLLPGPPLRPRSPTPPPTHHPPTDDSPASPHPV